MTNETDEKEMPIGMPSRDLYPDPDTRLYFVGPLPTASTRAWERHREILLQIKSERPNDENIPFLIEAAEALLRWRQAAAPELRNWKPDPAVTPTPPKRPRPTRIGGIFHIRYSPNVINTTTELPWG